jgi:arylsulfatase A-like enzyme
VVFAACAPEHPTRLDLLTLFAFTGHGAPTERIDLAGPDRRFLLRGWGDVTTLPDGTRGTPMVEPVAAVAYEAGATPVDSTLTVSGSSGPRLGPDGGAQRRMPQPFVLVIEVNGVRCRRGRTRERGDMTFLVPAVLQRPGRNVLTLRRLPGGPRTGTLSPPLVTRLEFTRQARRPQVEAIGNRLVISAGAGITFYLRAPQAPRLQFTTEQGREPVRTTLLADGMPPRVLATTAPGATADVSLPVAADATIGIRFESASRAVVVAPAVLGRARAERAGAPSHTTSTARPNVLLYVMDALRADRLGCYGYARDTSPHLDQFAAEAIVFRDAIAQAPWTRPSVASLLTGQLPMVHGAVTLRDRLRADVPTLAERFRAAGYDTAGFVTNINVAAPFGFDRGFDRYDHLPEDPATPGVYVSAGRLHAAALAWLDARAGERPFLLYLHATDVHSPYRPEPAFRARFLDLVPSDAELQRLDRRLERSPERLSADEARTLSGLYDAEVAQWDEAFGQLWAALRARGDDADTVVAFTADHGEEFHDHGGVEHGNTLYQEQVRVPLIVRLPAGRDGGRMVDALVRTVDVFPTLLDVAGLAPDGLTSGRAVVSARGAIDVMSAPEAVTSTQFTRREVEAIVLPPWKVVFPPPGAKREVEVYDLASDPGETRDVSTEHPVLVGYARQQLAAQKARAPSARSARPEPPVAQDVLERLRQLGYAVD